MPLPLWDGCGDEAVGGNDPFQRPGMQLPLVLLLPLLGQRLSAAGCPRQLYQLMTGLCLPFQKHLK